MTDYWVSGANLTSVADAIRAKTSTSAPLVFPSGFVSAINGISAPYYEIYSNLAYRTVMSSGYPGFSEWINTLSRIRDGQFAEMGWSGSYIFNNVTYIGEYAFARLYIAGQTGKGNSTAFTFPKCSTLSTAAFADNHFNLTSVYFPILSSINSYVFYRCTSLTTISFPSCTDIGISAFYRCDKLEIASFPECITIGSCAFQYCSKLTTISFPKCTTIYYNAFQYCSSITMANFSNCTSIYDYAFANCSSLTTVNFPNCSFIGSFAFQSCSKLATISFPSCTNIGNYAFANCYNSLTTASFPNCTSIGGYAFASCSKLTTASFPNCTYIGDYAFRSCLYLISLYLNNVSTITVLGNNAFSSTPISGYSTSAGRYGSVFVPSSLYNSFITATNWATISSRIVSV